MVIVRTHWIGYILLVSLLSAGCREEEPDVINKLDPRLKMQVDQVAKTPLSVFLHTEAELTEAQRNKLVSHDVVIQSHVGTVYVCQIPYRSVMDVAREPFIVRMEAPKELKPQ